MRFFPSIRQFHSQVKRNAKKTESEAISEKCIFTTYLQEILTTIVFSSASVY